MRTLAQVPYMGGVEVGTVNGVHTRKSAVVGVRYPNNPKLYAMERHLILGTAEAPEATSKRCARARRLHCCIWAPTPAANALLVQCSSIMISQLYIGLL